MPNRERLKGVKPRIVNRERLKGVKPRIVIASG
jgi:hypothetical protein